MPAFQPNKLLSEIPSGTVDGVNAVFTVLHTPSQLYSNGALQNPGAGNDYTISGLTITFASAPVVGSVLLSFYTN